MAIQFKQGRLIRRKFDQGLEEHTIDFDSVESLFEMIMATRAPYLVEKVQLIGTDDAGVQQTVLFTFQSVTVNRKLEN
jgi:hypothetical protein